MTKYVSECEIWLIVIRSLKYHWNQWVNVISFLIAFADKPNALKKGPFFKLRGLPPQNPVLHSCYAWVRPASSPDAVGKDRRRLPNRILTDTTAIRVHQTISTYPSFCFRPTTRQQRQPESAIGICFFGSEPSNFFDFENKDCRKYHKTAVSILGGKIQEGRGCAVSEIICALGHGDEEIHQLEGFSIHQQRYFGASPKQYYGC